MVARAARSESIRRAALLDYMVLKAYVERIALPKQMAIENYLDVREDIARDVVMARWRAGDIETRDMAACTDELLVPPPGAGFSAEDVARTWRLHRWEAHFRHERGDWSDRDDSSDSDDEGAPSPSPASSLGSEGTPQPHRLLLL